MASTPLAVFALLRGRVVLCTHNWFKSFVSPWLSFALALILYWWFTVAAAIDWPLLGKRNGILDFIVKSQVHYLFIS